MLRKPTREEWDAAVAAGFRSNGASKAPDTIFGVRIANADERFPPMPADLHDFRFFYGGPKVQFHDANAEFLVELYACIDEARLPELKREAARRRCRLYYEAVEEYGFRLWPLREESA